MDYLSGLALLCRSVTVASSAPKASWVVVMYTMNYNAMESDNQLAKLFIEAVYK